MALDKVVDSAVLNAAITATADAIRAKTGSADKIPWDESAGFKSAVEGITGGGGGYGYVFENTVNLGIEVVVLDEHVVTHCYYNGVKLPRIPEDVLAEYPYAWIRNNTTTGYYDLIMSNTPYYFNGDASIKEGAGVGGLPYYRVPISSAESASEWTTYGSHSFSSWGLGSARPVLWSSHDIPNGSADATDIYFEGTDPVPI